MHSVRRCSQFAALLARLSLALRDACKLL